MNNPKFNTGWFKSRYKLNWMGQLCLTRKEAGLKLRCLGVFNRFSLRTRWIPKDNGYYYQRLTILEDYAPNDTDREAIINAFPGTDLKFSGER